MRIYYDLIVWEEMEDNDTEKLMSKFTEFGKRLQGYGIVSWKMRAGQEQKQATQEEIDQYNAEQEALAESEQIEEEPQSEPQQEPQQITETKPGVEQEVVEE